MNDYRRHADETALDERVSQLLSAAAAPSEPGPLPGEGTALAAFRASQTTPARRPSMLSSLTSAKAGLAAALGAGVLLTGGVAAAATGALPGAAQDTARDMLGNVGITVPGPAEAAGDHPAARGKSGEARTDDDADATVEADATVADDATTDATDGAELPEASGKGQAVSEVATSDEYTGADKGAAVSELASEGKSQAGDEHGKSGEEHGKSGEEHGVDGPSVAAQVQADDTEDAEVEAEDDADDAEEDDDESSDERGERANARP